MIRRTPKLRTVDKTLPPFPLNQFPAGFAQKLGKELVYLIASKETTVLEGSEFESIFADCIGAQWKPSNVGLDDIVLGNTAWGAKTVKHHSPSSMEKVRLISGRNSPVYSFEEKIDTSKDPNEVGGYVLDIWNARVSSVREKYENLRTVVLIKSYDLTEVVVFEFETIRYDHELYSWQWNKNNNLEGIEKSSGNKKFTWQPHGSQFTIVEEVTTNSLLININKPSKLDKEKTLNAIGFQPNWVKVTQVGR